MQNKASLFLPINWKQSSYGVSAFSWADDPLEAQLLLSETEYRRFFPKNELHWPVLGELILPEDTLKTIVRQAKVEQEGNTLRFVMSLRNEGTETAKLDTVRMALPMDQCFRENDVFKYEQNVLRHAGLIGDGAWLYWQKPGGKSPVYVLVAQKGTAVDRFYVDERYDKDSMAATFEGLYQLEMENVPLLLAAGETKEYSFRMGIVESVHEIHDALVALGGLAVDAIPGMTAQRGDTIRIRLDSQREISQVYFAGDTMPVVRREDYYETTAEGAGEQKLLVSYADGGFSRLKFFVIDPVMDIFRDYAHFVSTMQFEQDPDDPCYHGILPWNMTDRCRVNSRHNPFADWMAGGSDEIGLVSGLFLSEKNCYWPDEQEIRVLGAHVQDFIEERLTEQPGNRVHRMVPWFVMFEPWAGYGADDVWRAFNYVHVVNICLNMYRIARAGNYPFLKPATHYLRRAYDYTLAMFAYWMFPDGEGATKFGNMGEMNLPLLLLPSLRKEGMAEEADHLEKILTEKAKYFSTREYPFGSEMAFDTTAYEAVYGYAKLIGDKRIAHNAVAASLSNRGCTPIWHKYGVDVRGGGDSCWNVSYMTQLGIVPVVDSLLEGTLEDPEAALMAYGATMAGFCIYNSGGCWDDAPVNRHATWWVLNERMMQGNRPVHHRRRMSGEGPLGYFGALYATCAFVFEHPRMGEVALGCAVNETAEGIRLIPAEGFGFRVCDLVHHVAIKCENAQVISVLIQENQIVVEGCALPGIMQNGVLKVRCGKTGAWQERTELTGDWRVSFSRQ